jgi:hypothetical protein
VQVQHDLFISHASEDKDAFVRALAELLERMRVTVWYDEFSLTAGDSLSESIDRGLEQSRFGAVVLSPHFLAKPWPKRELAGLTALEIARGKTIIPIWLNVTAPDVLRFSPTLADKKAISAEAGASRVVAELLRVVRPDLYLLLRESRELQSRLNRGREEEVRLEELTKGPLRRPTLDPAFLLRARLVREALVEVFPGEWRSWVDDFLRDYGPERELQTWEAIAGSYLAVVNEFGVNDLDERRALFRELLGRSIGGQPEGTRPWSARLDELQDWRRPDTGEDPRFASVPPTP